MVSLEDTLTYPVRQKHFVVGIGASAGGMEAIHEFFENMPADSGFSFVVIQHLSPDYKSLLGELLSRHTSMRVFEASDGMQLMPNCIYVIPSRKLIAVRDGRLKVSEKGTSKAPNFAVDIFFQSLAEDQGEQAIAIILSGTGTDGSRGIVEIKRSGGLVIVQDPLSASFDGMPNSALTTDAADMILPPEMMGQEILNYLKDGEFARKFKKLDDKEEGLVSSLLSHLEEVTRHDFSSYKRPMLLRRLAKRMSELGISDLTTYRNKIIEDEHELVILGKEFLINVTRFFRDEEAFEVLKRKVISAIVEKKSDGDQIKIWIVACSSGEEAYSIAMLVMEILEKSALKNVSLKIFATDIDNDALETASQGIYAMQIENDVPAALLKKYFTKEGSFYRVTAALRKSVVFAQHDVLKDPPFSRLDLVTCRNVFIYLDPYLQKKTLKKLHFALNVDSYLMLGPSENIGLLKNVMEEVDRKWKIYKCLTKSSVDELSMLDTFDYKGLYNFNKKPKERRLSHLEVFKDTLLHAHKIACIYVDKDYQVKNAIGHFKNFLTFPDDNFHFNLLKLVPSDLGIVLGICLRQVIMNPNEVVKRKVGLFDVDAKVNRTVAVTVKPYLNGESEVPLICIVLEEVEKKEVQRERVTDNDEVAISIAELEQELVSTRENLQAVIQEIESANEELQSSNEEMISTNEELQSTNEELQSLNEELHTLSAEHQSKINELLVLNDDMNNYFNNSTIGQILVDQNMIIRRFSPVTRKMINLIDSDIGRNIQDITSNLPNVHLGEDISNVMERNEPLEREVVNDKNEFILMRIIPYRKSNEKRDGVVINFIDITELKRLGSIIEGIFNTSPNGIIAMKAQRDSHRNIVGFELIATNPMAEKILGISPESNEQKKLSQSHYLHQNFFTVFKKVVVEGQEEKIELGFEDEEKWYEVVTVKMLDGVVATFTDISEKRQTEKTIAKNYEDLRIATQKLTETNLQLERSNFDLLQFASVASHDLKEPLRKIQAFGNILQARIKDRLDPGELNYLHKLISASGRMQTLIEDVLTLSKLSSSGLPREKTDLRKVVKRICEDLEITIKEKNAHVEIGPLPEISAVPGQMRQLFQNLVSNSLKFCNKPEPRISICERQITPEDIARHHLDGNPYICIVVKDNGIGFEEKYSEKIFGIFQRLHGRVYEGTGIGLAIAKKITENHHGVIAAKGKLNEGAEFEIFLPAVLPITPEEDLV